MVFFFSSSLTPSNFALVPVAATASPVGDTVIPPKRLPDAREFSFTALKVVELPTVMGTEVVRLTTCPSLNTFWRIVELIVLGTSSPPSESIMVPWPVGALVSMKSTKVSRNSGFMPSGIPPLTLARTLTASKNCPACSIGQPW